MAQSITYISGSPMSGSPLIYRVKAEQITLSADDVLTLHRLVLRIHAWLSTDTAANEKTYDYSVEVSSAEEVDFNISSALQSLAQTFTPQPATAEQTYPLVTYYLEAFDEYILNREKYTEVGFCYLDGRAGDTKSQSIYNSTYSQVSFTTMAGSTCKVGSQWYIGVYEVNGRYIDGTSFDKSAITSINWQLSEGLSFNTTPGTKDQSIYVIPSTTGSHNVLCTITMNDGTVYRGVSNVYALSSAGVDPGEVLSITPSALPARLVGKTSGTLTVAYTLGNTYRASDFSFSAMRQNTALDFGDITENIATRTFSIPLFYLARGGSDKITLALTNNGQTVRSEISIYVQPASQAGRFSLLGRYTDMERLFNPTGITYLDERLLTHKPRPTSLHPTVQPEIVSIGEKYLLPKVSGGISIKAPITSATAKAAVSPVAITTEGYRQLSLYRRVYAIDLRTSPDHYEFQFFNQLGIMESYCLQAARQTTVKATSTEYNHSIRETFSQLSRSLVRKTPGQEQWKLTSGPLDRHWLSWFIHDFLQAEYMWVKLTPYNSQLQGSYWVPCLIALDDNISGLDLTKRGEPLTVTFTLKLDLAGSTQAAEHYEPFRFDTTPLDSTYRLAD